MADSKNKKIHQRVHPSESHVVRSLNVHFYDEHPSWNFNSCDTELWPFTKESIGLAIWDEILPRLKSFETQTWREILLVGKKQNHSEDVQYINPAAQKRLADKYIELESIISLRLNGTHRIYGYMVGSVFNIIWYDPHHGDNSNCVYRSHKKHT